MVDKDAFEEREDVYRGVESMSQLEGWEEPEGVHKNGIRVGYEVARALAGSMRVYQAHGVSSLVVVTAQWAQQLC